MYSLISQVFFSPLDRNFHHRHFVESSTIRYSTKVDDGENNGVESRGMPNEMIAFVRLAPLGFSLRQAENSSYSLVANSSSADVSSVGTFSQTSGMMRKEGSGRSSFGAARAGCL